MLTGSRIMRVMTDRRYRAYLKAKKRARWDFEINRAVRFLALFAFLGLVFLAFMLWGN